MPRWTEFLAQHKDLIPTSCQLSAEELAAADYPRSLEPLYPNPDDSDNNESE